MIRLPHGLYTIKLHGNVPNNETFSIFLQINFPDGINMLTLIKHVFVTLQCICNLFCDAFPIFPRGFLSLTNRLLHTKHNYTVLLASQRITKLRYLHERYRLRPILTPCYCIQNPSLQLHSTSRWLTSLSSVWTNKAFSTLTVLQTSNLWADHSRQQDSGYLAMPPLWTSPKQPLWMSLPAYLPFLCQLSQGSPIRTSRSLIALLYMPRNYLPFYWLITLRQC